MATQRRTNGNNVWVRFLLAPVLVILLAGAVTGAVAVAWSLNGRVTRCETVDKEIARRLAALEENVQELLRRVPPRP